MSVKIFSSLLVLLVVCRLSAFAQDPSLSLYFAHPTIITPSMAGVTRSTMEGTFSHRKKHVVKLSTPELRAAQAEEIANYNTSLFSFDLPIDQEYFRGGIGVLVSRDIVGSQAVANLSGNIRKTDVQLAVSYEAPLGAKVRYQHLRAGFSGGASFRDIDNSGFTFEDQFNGGVLVNKTSAENWSTDTRIVADFNLGLLWYRDQKIPGNPEINPFFGLSLHHFNKPNFRFLADGESYALAPRYGMLGGVKIRTRKPFDFNFSAVSFWQNGSWVSTPTFFFKKYFYENEWFGQEKYSLVLGTTYKVLSIRSEALVIFFGAEIEQDYQISFGYDVLVNANYRQMFSGQAGQLSTDSFGGFHVMFGYKYKPQSFSPGNALPFPDF